MTDKNEDGFLVNALGKALKVGNFVEKTAHKVSENVAPIAQKATERAKQGAEKVAAGAKLGAEKISDGVKNGAEKVKETVEEINFKKNKTEADTIDDEITNTEADAVNTVQEETTEEIPEEIIDSVNTKELLNTVIDGSYCDQKVTLNKNKLFVGEKEVNTLNCESYRNPDNRECVKETKAKFAEYKKNAKNPMDKLINDNYITVVWRTGEKSVLCVDKIKKAMVIKLLS